MPLVFLHGVTVREGEEYELETELRNQLFLDVFYPLLGMAVDESSILNPLWGDLAPSVTPSHPFLPNTGLSSWRRRYKPGSIVGGMTRNLLQKGVNPILEKSIHPLLETARKRSIDEMLDLLISHASEDLRRVKDRRAGLKSLSAFAYQSVRWRERFASRKSQLEWLEGVGSDEELIEKLESEVAGISAKKGLKARLSAARFRTWLREQIEPSGDRLKEGIGQSRRRLKDSVEASRQRIADRMEKSRDKLRAPLLQAGQRVKGGARATLESARKLATGVTAAAISSPARRMFHSQMTAFIGDSFFYFGTRGERFEPGAVPALCTQAIEEADNLRTADDPYLIVVAHSMGSNIICDILSYFAPHLDIDCVITVGAQFPLFADLDMFPGFSAEERPIPCPGAARNWLNFYDPNDFLGYAAGAVFDGIIDIPYSSGKFGVSTHADYFKYVSFYELMGRSVRSVLSCSQTAAISPTLPARP